MFVIAIVLWPSASDSMSMHRNFAGEIDGCGGKFEERLRMPIVATFIWSPMNFIPWLRPEKFKRGLRVPFFLFVYAAMFLDVSVFAVQAMHAHGQILNTNCIVWPLVVFLWVCVGYLILSAVRLKSREGSPPQLGVL